MAKKKGFVQCKEFAEFDENGRLSKLFCKGCGTVIAETTDGKFRRNKRYMEAKLLFTDGSYHVTHGCSECLNKDLSPKDIEDIMKVDLQGMEGPILKRKGSQLVKRDATKSGIL